MVPLPPITNPRAVVLLGVETNRHVSILMHCDDDPAASSKVRLTPGDENEQFLTIAPMLDPIRRQPPLLGEVVLFTNRMFSKMRGPSVLLGVPSARSIK